MARISNKQLFLTEGSAAGADVGDQGQLWVKDDTPNKLMFTDGSGNTISLSLRYTSAETTITSGANTVLTSTAPNETPRHVTSWLVCQVAENGFTVGSRMPAPILGDNDAVNRGHTVQFDGQTITVHFGSNANVFMLVSQVDNTVIALTNANWTLVVEVDY